MLQVCYDLKFPLFNYFLRRKLRGLKMSIIWRLEEKPCSSFAVNIIIFIDQCLLCIDWYNTILFVVTWDLINFLYLDFNSCNCDFGYWGFFFGSMTRVVIRIGLSSGFMLEKWHYRPKNWAIEMRSLSSLLEQFILFVFTYYSVLRKYVDSFCLSLVATYEL